MTTQETAAERRRKLWRMYFINGVPYTEVTERLADEYDVKVNTIEKDIANVDEWLAGLADKSFTDGISRLKEIRGERQRMHRLAREARNGEGTLNRKDERQIRKDIVDMVEKDIKLSQSLGQTIEAAQQHEHSVEGAIDVDVNPGEQYQQMLEQAEEVRQREGFDASAFTDGPETVEVMPEDPMDGIEPLPEGEIAENPDDGEG